MTLTQSAIVTKQAQECRWLWLSTLPATITSLIQVVLQVILAIMLVLEPDGKKEIKLRESSGEKTTFYFDDLKVKREFTVCLAYQVEVANPKPAFVTVQDYYKPTEKSDVKFSLDGRQVRQISFDWLDINFRMRARATYADASVRRSALSSIVPKLFNQPIMRRRVRRRNRPGGYHVQHLQ